MKAPTGITTAIKAIVNEMKEEGQTIFPTKDIEAKAMERTTLRDADPEWKDHVIMTLYMAVALKDMGMRSILRSKGYYTSKNTDNPIILAQLIRNAGGDMETAQIINDGFKRHQSEMMDGQMYLDSNGEMAENPSAEDVLDEIRRVLGIEV